jgi:hypothetical protein
MSLPLLLEHWEQLSVENQAEVSERLETGNAGDNAAKTFGDEVGHYRGAGIECGLAVGATAQAPEELSNASSQTDLPTAGGTLMRVSFLALECVLVWRRCEPHINISPRCHSSYSLLSHRPFHFTLYSLLLITFTAPPSTLRFSSPPLSLLLRYRQSRSRCTHTPLTRSLCIFLSPPPLSL